LQGTKGEDYFFFNMIIFLFGMDHGSKITRIFLILFFCKKEKICGVYKDFLKSLGSLLLDINNFQY